MYAEIKHLVDTNPVVAAQVDAVTEYLVGKFGRLKFSLAIRNFAYVEEEVTTLANQLAKIDGITISEED